MRQLIYNLPEVIREAAVAACMWQQQQQHACGSSSSSKVQAHKIRRYASAPVSL
jgi:hypothetical protein